MIQQTNKQKSMATGGGKPPAAGNRILKSGFLERSWRKSRERWVDFNMQIIVERYLN